ncbi:unnamed protein product [Brassica oleracea var. botrytis]|uniref:TCP domain-containing protein n=3 Tax=Brassica TaxID=3705 RepID=A0A0D3CZ23_BRAOL|nr:unnamed protein product [Brassica napus]CDY33597.1 BnaC06g29550D [Brassica napus]VDD63866.1 unnamed protein product [Brassica oleracea]
MFPSLDTSGYDLFDPFNPHQATMLPFFTTPIQSPSSHHHYPLSSFPFSSDFLDESVLISSFLLAQQDAATHVADCPRKLCKKLEDKCVGGTTLEKVPRRRTGKKRDRHSKICTAQGPRDRRMRLSQQIARKFFNLQDMLGFDKASKTIEWLISQSKASIRKVKESVDASGGGEGDDEHLQDNEKAKEETMKVSRRRTKTVENSCKKKESREKARERARERTLTKMKMRISGLIDTSKIFSDPIQESQKIELTGGAQVEGKSPEQESSTTNVNMVEYQMDSVRTIEKFLGLNSDASSSSIFGDSEESYASLSQLEVLLQKQVTT